MNIRPMMKKYPKLTLWLVGAGFGLVFGLTWWFAWGCRRCAEGDNPFAIIAIITVVGAGMGRYLGRDHLPRQPDELA